MKQTLLFLIVPVFSTLVIFSPGKEIEPIKKEIIVPTNPTTEELIRSTTLYSEVKNIEWGIDSLHIEVLKLSQNGFSEIN